MGAQNINTMKSKEPKGIESVPSDVKVKDPQCSLHEPAADVAGNRFIVTMGLSFGVGCIVGLRVGFRVGNSVGNGVGNGVGSSVGCCCGTTVEGLVCIAEQNRP